MDDLGSDDGKQNKYNPKQDQHPDQEAGIVFITFRDFEKSGKCIYRGREYTKEKHYEMIQKESAMSRVLRFEKPDLVNNKVGNYAEISVQDLKNEPESAG